MKRYPILRMFAIIDCFLLKALCFDLLSPVSGEICGGSVREDSLELLERRAKQIKSGDNLDWY